MRNATEKDGLRRSSFTKHPMNLKTAIHDNETVEVTVDVVLNSYESMQKPIKRTLYICTEPEKGPGNLTGMRKCFWAAKPAKTVGMKYDFRMGYCTLENGNLSRLHYYFSKVVHGVHKHVRQYYSIYPVGGFTNYESNNEVPFPVIKD